MGDRMGIFLLTAILLICLNSVIAYDDLYPNGTQNIVYLNHETFDLVVSNVLN